MTLFTNLRQRFDALIDTRWGWAIIAFILLVVLGLFLVLGYLAMRGGPG